MDEPRRAVITSRCTSQSSPASGLKRTLPAILAAALVLAPTSQAAISFTETTQQAGMTHSAESYGAAWGDLNSDGWPDLFVDNHRDRVSLFRNNGDGTFNDVALSVETAGIWTTLQRQDQHGAAWGDYDNDGDQDLIVITGSGYNDEFYINEGGTLRDATEEARLLYFGATHRTPLWMDWDQDGRLDLILSNRAGAFNLLEQSGNQFFNRNGAAGFACEKGQFVQAADLVGSGDLEIICYNGIAPTYVYDTSTIPFRDVTAQVFQHGNARDVVIADLDGNLRQDMLLVRARNHRYSEARIKASDNTVVEAQLLVQGGQEKGFEFKGPQDLAFRLREPQAVDLTKVFIGSGGSHPSGQNFSISATDPDTWGIKPHATTDQGIYIGYDQNTATWQVREAGGGGTAHLYTTFVVDGNSPIQNLTWVGFGTTEWYQPPALYLNKSTGFIDSTSAAKLNKSVSCVAGVAADFDNDMDMDVYLVCRGGLRNLENVIFENLGDGTFRQITGHGAEGSSAGVGENVVTADYDVDGFVDLFVTNGINLVEPFTRGPLQLFRNSGNGNHWVEFDLQGTISNRDGIGAKVIATAGGKAQMREQNGGIHRWAQNHQRLHFGLAGNTNVDLRIEWPSGSVDTYTGVAADRLYRVVEGTRIEPVELGSVPPPPPSPTGAEGQPIYDPAVDRGLFLWVQNGTWHLRGTAGGGNASYHGEIVASAPFGSVTPYSIEASDVLDTSDPNRIRFEIAMSDRWEDGFDFTFPAGAHPCLSLTVPADGTVELGAGRSVTATPFDLETLGPCDGAAPGLSVADVSVDEGAGVARFTVSLSSAASDTVAVEYATRDGSAVAGLDYISASGTLSFPAGTTSLAIEVSIIDDETSEGTENFFVDLTTPVNAVISRGTATGSITDNDSTGSVPCGEPTYNPATETGLFLWQSCSSGVWSLRGTAGGGYARYEGSLQSTEPFTAITPVSIESHDSLETGTAGRIDLVFQIWGTSQDGVDFGVADGAEVCVDLDAPVQVGPDRTSVSSPFSLTTLGACGSSPTPGHDSGTAPNYDPATEAGLFLWHDADGIWHLRGTAGNDYARYIGNIAGDQPWSSVTGVSIESHDVLDISDPQRIDFNLQIWGSGEDGIDFAFPTGTNICFGGGSAGELTVKIGGAKTEVVTPFDLDTFLTCTLP